MIVLHASLLGVKTNENQRKFYQVRIEERKKERGMWKSVRYKSNRGKTCITKKLVDLRLDNFLILWSFFSLCLSLVGRNVQCCCMLVGRVFYCKIMTIYGELTQASRSLTAASSIYSFIILSTVYPIHGRILFDFRYSFRPRTNRIAGFFLSWVNNQTRVNWICSIIRIKSNKLR